MAASLPVFRDTGSQCASVRLLAFPKQAAVGSFGASGSSRNVSRCTLLSSVCQAAGKNRGQAFHQDSEQLQDDRERGITQSCLPSQDHGNPWNRSECSLYLAIFLDLNLKLIHRGLTFLFLSGKFINPQLFRFFSITFSILLFPEDFSYDPLGDLFLFCPILCKTNLSLSGNDQMTDSPGSSIL